MSQHCLAALINAADDRDCWEPSHTHTDYRTRTQVMVLVLDDAARLSALLLKIFPCHCAYDGPAGSWTWTTMTLPNALRWPLHQAWAICIRPGQLHDHLQACAGLVDLETWLHVVAAASASLATLQVQIAHRSALKCPKSQLESAQQKRQIDSCSLFKKQRSAVPLSSGLMLISHGHLLLELSCLG